MSFSQSIFDTKDIEELKEYKLWNRKLPGLKISDPVSYSLFAAKKAKTGESFDLRPFYTTKPGFLYYKKSPESSKIRGAMDLKWARIRFERINVQEAMETGFQYSVKIIKNLKFTTLYLKDEEAVEHWRGAMLKDAALTDFHDKYEVVDIIGKGAFAKVTLRFSRFEFFTIFSGFLF